MVVSQKHRALLKKLKKQVRNLARREGQAKNKLRSALKKIRKLGKAYKSTLAKKVNALKDKVDAARSSTYAKARSELETQLLKNVEAKSNAIKAAVAKIERKHAAKLTKSLVKKVRKVKKARTVVPGKKARRSVKTGRSRKRS